MGSLAKVGPRIEVMVEGLGFKVRDLGFRM